jgi:hypothetical protein
VSIRLFILLSFASLGLLKADMLTYATSTQNGDFQYSFDLTNSGGAGGSLFDLFVHLPIDISNVDTAAIGSPPGWGGAGGGLLFFGPDVSPSTSFVEWASDFSGAFDLGVNNALSGFSISTLQLVPPPITFALNDSTVLQTAQPATATAVPEPSEVTVLIALLVVVRARRLRSIRSDRDQGATVTAQ